MWSALDSIIAGELRLFCTNTVIVLIDGGTTSSLLCDLGQSVVSDLLGRVHTTS